MGWCARARPGGQNFRRKTGWDELRRQASFDGLPAGNGSAVADFNSSPTTNRWAISRAIELVEEREPRRRTRLLQDPAAARPDHVLGDRRVQRRPW
jgi:hypothetical protein